MIKINTITIMFSSTFLLSTHTGKPGTHSPTLHWTPFLHKALIGHSIVFIIIVIILAIIIIIIVIITIITTIIVIIQVLSVHCTQLKKVSVRGCEMVGDPGVSAIARACRGLQQLNIQDCTEVTLDSYRTVKRHCQRCIIEHTNPGFH